MPRRNKRKSIENGSSSNSKNSRLLPPPAIALSPSSPSEEDQPSNTEIMNRQIRAIINSSSTQLGPKYPKLPNSIILNLTAMSEDDTYHQVNNPEGIVPVVVHPHFTNLPNELKLTEEQKDGLQFMWDAFAKERRGCILGHGMGLGKSLTSLTFIFTLLEQSENSRGKSKPTVRKILLLAPKGVLSVWEKEIAQWSPTDRKLDYIIIESSTKTATAMDSIKAFESNEKELIMMSYDSFKKNQYYNLFRDYEEPLGLAICDEVHYLKNAEAQRSLALGMYELDNNQGKRRTVKTIIGLTGTPYQNNEEEFCNLVNCVWPGNLPPTTPSKLKSLRSADAASKNPNKSTEEQFEAKMRAHAIRKELHPLFEGVIQYRSGRVKNVDKHELLVCVKLRDVQHKLYTALTESEEFQKLGSFIKIDILTKVCIHPACAYQAIAKRLPSIVNKFAKDFKKMLKEDGSIEYSLYAESCKIRTTVWLMTSILLRKNSDNDNSKPPDKLVVVSYSNEQLAFVKSACDEFGWKYLVYDGDLASESKRKEVLDKFNSNGLGFRILLLSSEAGGQGLNLPVANHLILMDPGWNPAIDNQIVHRIYRKGQLKDCTIYRLLATDTIDEVMMLNQLSKTELGKYYQENELDLEPQSGYDAKDLTKYHRSPSGSFIKETLDEINNGLVQDENVSIERKVFANDLSECKQYGSAEELPEVLDDLKQNWVQGVTFAFHKFMGDDGSSVFRTLEEVLEVSESEDEEHEDEAPGVGSL